MFCFQGARPSCNFLSGLEQSFSGIFESLSKISFGHWLDVFVFLTNLDMWKITEGVKGLKNIYSR